MLQHRPARNALYIGLLCAVAYLAVYVVRNMLSAVTPQMLADGGFTEGYIGQISSVYLTAYAVGQLINGVLGDRIKPKYMICGGLLLAGVMNLLFPMVAPYRLTATAVYGVSGFFLSMIYGPLVKVIAENTEDPYTVRCSLGFTFSSFLGSPFAGLLAAVLTWQSVFAVGSGMLIAMAAVCFAVFILLEKSGIVQYGRYTRTKQTATGGVKVLIKRQIIKFSLISILTGVVRTSVVFWLPTYLMQYLGYTADQSAEIFTVATFIISFEAFIAIFLYERLGHNLHLTVLVHFAAATVLFGVLYFVELPILNIILIMLAIMMSNGAASMLYSKYCPSLYDTGMVSSATGFLDFLSYIAAAVANIAFANAAPILGWNNLILVWMALTAAGVVVSLPYKRAEA